MFVFKIRDIESGLFSSGGAKPTFSKTGKSWTSIGHLRNHITRVKNRRKDYNGCEVVRFELTPETTIPLDQERPLIFDALKQLDTTTTSTSGEEGAVDVDIPEEEITQEEIEAAKSELEAASTTGETPW